jgi:DNA-binding response OmpR family regulator
MIPDKRKGEIAESLRRLVVSYRATVAEVEETLVALCRKLELDQISILDRDLTFASARQAPRYELSGLVIDRLTFTVRWRGRSCYLNNTLPFRLLERLARRPNQYVSCAQLLDDVWEGAIRSKAAIRSVVKVLRQKLSKAGMRDLASAIDGRTKGYYTLRT